MSGASLSAAKARRATVGSSGKQETKHLSRRDLRGILPQPWDVLTAHDKDLKAQSSHNERFSSQIVDLANIVTALQKKIEGDDDSAQAVSTELASLRAKVKELESNQEELKVVAERLDKVGVPGKKSKSGKN